MINNFKIKQVSVTKYLGLYIDEALSWTIHINHITKQIIRFVGIFYKLRNKLPNQILQTLYFSMIYPHLLYGIELYGNTCSSNLDPLIKINNKILRILQSKPYRSHTRDLYIQYNTLPIPLLFRFDSKIHAQMQSSS
jgi:hypothetical protein